MQRVRDRLIDPATANQPAAHDRLPLVVGRAIDAAWRALRIVEDVERRATGGRRLRELRRSGRAPGAVAGGAGARRSASRAWPTASCSITAVAPGASSSGVAAGRRRRRLARPEAGHQGPRDALGLVRLRAPSARAPKRPQGISTSRLKKTSRSLSGTQRGPDHLQIATMPARGQAQREGDVMSADGALELAGEGAQRSPRGIAGGGPDRELRLDHRRRLGARHLAQGARQIAAGDPIAAREPGVRAAHQAHREPLLAADPQTAARLGRRPLGVDAALEVDLGQIARFRGDGRERPRHRRCVELGPGHSAAIVPQRGGPSRR